MNVQSKRNFMLLTMACVIGYCFVMLIGYSVGEHQGKRAVKGVVLTHDAVQLKHSATKTHEVNVGSLITIDVLPNEKITKVIASDVVRWQIDTIPLESNITAKCLSDQPISNQLIIETNKNKYTLILNHKKGSKTTRVQYIK